MRLIKDYRLYRVVALGWMVTILWLSSQSDLPTPSLFAGQDKLGHAIIFGILGFLFSRSFKPRERVSPSIRVLLITLMVAVYGGLDEAHQLFVSGRIASMGDLLADLAGGFLAAVIFWKR